MTLHPFLAQVAAIGNESAVTVGFVGTVVFVAIVIGESRWQVSHLREWRRQAEADTEALRARITALEVREGRTLERLDALADRLNRIEAKLDKLLERRESA